MPRVLDAHHHLWSYSAEEYGWIDDSMARIRRDFDVADLAQVMREADVDGAIAVQARQTLEETRWLLELAEASTEIFGVVGWAPIADRSFISAMEAFAGRSKLRGLRHVVQAEPDGFLFGAAFNAGIAQLRHLGLTYDILIQERQLPEAIAFVDRHPEQPFVLDHIAKPRIREGAIEPWALNIRELAQRENVCCKLSGLVTEADWSHWTLAQLKPYIDVVVEAFGPSRLMVGSDWPVCLLASEYVPWFSLLREYFASFTAVERSDLFGGTAARFYGV